MARAPAAGLSGRAPYRLGPVPGGRRLLSSCLVSLALAVLLPAAGSEAQRSRRGDPLRDVSWTRAEFKASKLMLTARAHVALAARPSRELIHEGSALGSSPPLRPRGPAVVAIEVGSSLLGRHSLSTIWVRPTDHAVLFRRQEETGKRQRIKLERFSPGAVITRRIVPAEGERDLAPNEWSERRDEAILLANAEEVSDPAALFWLLSVADPADYERGRPFRVLSKGEARTITIRYVGVEELKARFVIHGRGGERAAPNRVRALHYTLHPEASDAELKLLGLEGDLDLYIEERYRVPLRVSGRVPPVGRVAANLRAVWLDD